MLADIEKDTVNFVPNYDESLTMPEVLPARFPNLLVNGSSGIAVGMATNIPPHNLGEVCDAVSYLIEHPDASLDRSWSSSPARTSRPAATSSTGRACGTPTATAAAASRSGPSP